MASRICSIRYRDIWFRRSDAWCQRGFRLQRDQQSCVLLVARALHFRRNYFSHRSFSSSTEVHGGDDVHRIGKLVCDFSVTSNPLGPVPDGVRAAQRLLSIVEEEWTTPRGGDVKAILEDQGERIMSASVIEQYPNRDDPELTHEVAKFLRLEGDAEGDAQNRLLFGNGASELIDLLARAAPQGPYCTSPVTRTQYKEYDRACQAAGRKLADAVDAAILCLVNPANPTGDFMERDEIEAWISENASPGSWVVVDESFLCFAGPDWHERGVSSAFIQKMLKRHINIFIVYSWTKLFACSGQRIGSVICPTLKSLERLRSLQVPWSVSTIPSAYLKAALRDQSYLERTWRIVPHWREQMVVRLKRLHPSWQFLGQPWLSWVMVDTGDPAVAEDVYKTSLECGCPVRHASAGYGLPSFIRIAVRRPYDFSVLYQALLQRECYSGKPGRTLFGTYADVHPGVIEGVQLVHIDDVKPHEEVVQSRADKLMKYVEDLPIKILPAIIVESQYKVVIDGHHRLDSFRRAGMTIVPAVFVNYEHEDVLVHPPTADKAVAKETVIFNALKGQLLPPKSTQHMVRSRGGTLLPIIVLAPQIAELQ